MKKELTTLTVFTLFTLSFANVFISEVFYDPAGHDTGKEWIEIFNDGNQPVDMTNWDLDPDLGNYYTFPEFVIQPNAHVTVFINTVGENSATELYTGETTNMGNSKGVVALFDTTTHAAATIVDFVQWGEGGLTNESKAVSAEIWTEGDFVPTVEQGYSMGYDGAGNSSKDWSCCTSPTPGSYQVSVKRRNAPTLPDKSMLLPNFPNPFNPSTIIPIELRKNTFVTLTIYDMLGKAIKVLVDTELQAGHHTFRWDGTANHGQPVGSGVYLVSLETATFKQTRKLIKLK